MSIIFFHCSISIVGILSQKVWGKNASYIAASYVKYIESAGARVVPILYPMKIISNQTKILTQLCLFLLNFHDQYQFNNRPIDQYLQIN